jgi:hypothetical protein
VEEVGVGAEGDPKVGREGGDWDVWGEVDDCRELGPYGSRRSSPYFPSGCTFTKTFFLPMTLTTSPT